MERNTSIIMPSQAEFTAEYQRIAELNHLTAFLPLADSFYRLTQLLLQANAKHNLTAVTEPRQILFRHYADCLAITSYFPKNATVIDVGCGAGFPSLPLAIARPDLKITALDSTAKKLGFVSDTAEALGLNNLTTYNSRAEEAAASALRESFDVATARAVARLNVLDELCLPFVRVGGQFLALKGEAGAEEAAEAASGIRQLGGSHGKCFEIPLTDGTETLHHVLFSCRKEKATAENFPRNYARISKKPL